MVNNWHQDKITMMNLSSLRCLRRSPRANHCNPKWLYFLCICVQPRCKKGNITNYFSNSICQLQINYFEIAILESTIGPLPKYQEIIAHLTLVEYF